MDHSEHTGDKHACCKSAAVRTSVCQSLSEMDFERGIWYAAQTNDLDRVNNLLKKGTSASAEDLAGYTPLHYAARNGHYKICEMLLENGANVNAITRSGRATALHRAAMQGHQDIVKLLLNAKADPNMRDDDGYTALHRAVLANSSSVCKLLIPRTNPKSLDKNGRTALQLAVEKGYQILVKMFDPNSL
ncbi:ankyrin repeat domain-containing protein 39 [Orussus abietinus]|uniref:ankyrin repeat domain-containing protein 39 n=1 Tax=Orussus abietinus TaxID=222816 RepID=UPI000626BD48|nr:ankyrin repeat domain-containing protein 39 [Orussus abietinus]